MQQNKKIKKVFFRLKSKFIIVYARLLGYSFREAINNNEKREVSALRFRIYSEEKYITPTNHEDNLLVDKYTPYSLDFIAVHNHNIIGTIRITKDSVCNFPTENLFNIDRIKDREETIEVGRLVIDRKHRKQNNRLVMFGLAYVILNYSNNNHIKYWLCNMPEKLANSFKIFGANLCVIKQGPLTHSNIESRKIISGYFERYVLFPYIIDISQIGV